LFDAQVDQVLNNDFGGVGTTIYNTGIFRKELTTGSTTLTSGIMVDNSGTLDVQSGNLSLQGGYSLTNGTLNVGINSLTNNGTISLTGAAPLVGTVSANLNNGYQPVSGNSFTNIYYGSYTGGFSNSVLPFLDAWSTNYFPTCFVLNVLNARPIFVAPNTNRFVVNELTTLNVPNTAMDADLPPQALVYGLVAGTNGVAVNSSTGLLTWTPQQTNSPTTNVFSVAVTDNGTPALSATNTYTVIVREVNVPPSLSAVPTKTVNELTLLTVNDTATNANIHSTNSGYALVNPPSGMVISASGVITWTPAQTQSPSTNTITTIVTNSNPYAVANPHLTATNTFTVVVKEVNQAPTLPLVGTQTVTLLQLFTRNNSATEPNIHSTNFGYALISPPTGAAISSGGIITWTPAPNQTLTTNTLTTVVTNGNPYDAVNPRLTVTNSFKAVVRPSLVRTNVTLTASGSSLNLAWPADHTGWELQAQTNTLAVGIGSNWAIVSGSQDTNQMTLPIVSTNPAVFFRIAYP
jgi:hypothetical protein